MTDPRWIDAALCAARPQALAALLRSFRDLDVAEEAFQNACVRALRNWPENGPPRDPVAWLILVGRNCALDEARRRARQPLLSFDPETLQQLPASAPYAGDPAGHVDVADYRDDVLRLLFVCCHPRLTLPQQIALALRIVSGLSTAEIARAFLVATRTMEQRITRAKARIAAARVPFEAPAAAERARRLAAVATTLYLLFNEGYSASDGRLHVRAPLCEEAIRLARLLLRLFPADPELMGLAALMLLQHSRCAARLDARGEIVLLEDQDRQRWDRAMIGEGLALLDKAMRHRRSGPYQLQAAIAALHARAPCFDDTDWTQIERLYAALEALQPTPVIRLNRAVAVARVQGAEAALAMIAPLAQPLQDYFHFHGVQGALLLQLGREVEARHAFDRAIAYAGTAAEAAHIRRNLDRLVRRGRDKGAVLSG